MHDQLQFADATGDAVIISAGVDGEVVFTRKPQGDGHLVSTNFNVANPNNGYGYPCQRYDTATRLLSELVNQEGELTAQHATDVLDAVHVEGGASWTIESMVADLPNGVVYLYYFHQFDKPVVLNVVEEIANARAGGPLSDLFPEDVQEEGTRRYQKIQSRRNRFDVLGKVWLGLVLTSFLVFLVGSLKKQQGLFFWIPVVLILGPLGLLVWLSTGRKQSTGNWQAILVETAGDVAPLVISFLVYILVAIYVPAVQASQILQILLIFGVPLLIVWLVFQGPLLALGTKTGYLKTLSLRLPHTWITANLGMAVVFAIAGSLVNMSLQIPIPAWTIVSWWAFAVMGSLVAIPLLLLYESWSVGRGNQGWNILAQGGGEVTTPGWRRLWWWIPISFIILIGGIVGFIFLLQVLSG
jgi:hypothetical protein